ncbi:glycosyltransferase [Candidatus Uhrbacteria bacterium]|nr:glycosyltransferase [Candidatus Uhrbacteria bacterium]
MQEGKIILLTGGGTLGSVTPLLAIAEAWRALDASVEFVWAGTHEGPEERFVRAAGIPFYALSAPKLTRYPSLSWLLILPRTVRSLWLSWRLVQRLRPAWILSAGSYVSVPLVWAGKGCRARVMAYQLDVKPGLANRLIAPIADRFYGVWEGTRRQFGADVRVVGMAISADRTHLPSRETARAAFPSLTEHRPTILVLGGGLGSSSLNHCFEAAAMTLTQAYNVIHLTGKGKHIFIGRVQPDGYVVHEELQETYSHAMALADVVVTRAGMGALADVVAGGKAAVLVPLRGAQEKNAHIAEKAGAALVLRDPSPTSLLPKIHEALNRRQEFEKNIRSLFPVIGVARRIAQDLQSWCAGRGSDPRP